jgi:hypothetical protein
MTLAEAIQSGKRFRRPGNPNWHMKYDKLNRFPPPGNTAHWHYDDILADDWEIEEKSVTVTRRQLWNAMGSYHRCDGGLDMAFKLLCDQLGLDE